MNEVDKNVLTLLSKALNYEQIEELPHWNETLEELKIHTVFCPLVYLVLPGKEGQKSVSVPHSQPYDKGRHADFSDGVCHLPDGWKEGI